jgi:hypothetical protein
MTWANPMLRGSVRGLLRIRSKSAVRRRMSLARGQVTSRLTIRNSSGAG